MSDAHDPAEHYKHDRFDVDRVAQVGSISTARAVRVVAAHIRTPPLLWTLLVFGGVLVVFLLFVVTARIPCEFDEPS